MKNFILIFAILIGLTSCSNGSNSNSSSDSNKKKDNKTKWKLHEIQESIEVTGNPRALKLFDINGDDILDIAVTQFGLAKVLILLGDENGSFSESYDLNTSNNPYDLQVVDIDEDGDKDILVSTWSSKIDVFLSDGAGNFAAKVSYTTGINAINFAIEDFNEDDNLDLAVLNYGSGRMNYLEGNGDGTFDAKIDYSVGGAGAESWSIVSGDFNKDENVDVIAINFAANNYSFLAGNGDGTFDAKVDYSLTDGDNPTGSAANDLNQDGNLDLIIQCYSSNVLRIFYGNGDGTFNEAAETLAYDGNGYEVLIADMNNDERLDIVTSGDTNGIVSIWLAEDDFFQGPHELTVTGNPRGIALGDINKDNFLDIVTADWTDSKIDLMLSP